MAAARIDELMDEGRKWYDCIVEIDHEGETRQMPLVLSSEQMQDAMAIGRKLIDPGKRLGGPQWARMVSAKPAIRRPRDSVARPRRVREPHEQDFLAAARKFARAEIGGAGKLDAVVVTITRPGKRTKWHYDSAFETSATTSDETPESA